MYKQMRVRSRSSRPRLRAPARYSYENRAQAQAERLLLRAALADAGNQRFVLVSETCIPLYPGPVVWAQLAGEPRSRLHACRNDSDPADAGRRMAFRRAHGPARPPPALPRHRSVPPSAARQPARLSPWWAGGDRLRMFLVSRPLKAERLRPRRWQPAMAGGQLQEEHWRKNGQWFSLTRAHAELVVADAEVADAFKRCGRAQGGMTIRAPRARRLAACRARMFLP